MLYSQNYQKNPFEGRGFVEPSVDLYRNGMLRETNPIARRMMRSPSWEKCHRSWRRRVSPNFSTALFLGRIDTVISAIPLAHSGPTSLILLMDILLESSKKILFFILSRVILMLSLKKCYLYLIR